MLVQRSGIAAGGGFFKVQPGTTVWLCFIVEVKNFARLYSSAETEADSST